jgi:hypothetical protein
MVVALPYAAAVAASAAVVMVAGHMTVRWPAQTCRL